VDIKIEAMCGTLESNDLLVKVEPRSELEVVISSVVMRQFGVRIRQVVDETLQRMEVTHGLFVIEDKGALDCTIQARVQTAVMRASECEGLDWSVL
jgi:citrate lyase subunit gamma (acyl carrier protein)